MPQKPRPAPKRKSPAQRKANSKAAARRKAKGRPARRKAKGRGTRTMKEKASRTPAANAIRIDHAELTSLVMSLFCDGKPVREICEAIKVKYGKEQGELTRHQIYTIIKGEAKRFRLKYVPPLEMSLATILANDYPWLERINVVHTAVLDQVVNEAAQTLLRMIKTMHRLQPEKKDVHIGFAAGTSMQYLAQAFAQLLSNPHDDLPERLVLHALVSGHSPGRPATNANSFFSYFFSHPALDVEIDFVGLHAPAIVNSEHIGLLKDTYGIKESFAQASLIDIIVTSGSDWSDPHSSLYSCMARSSITRQRLEEAGTVCDMLWQPLGMTAPITCSTRIRALTLIELTDLQQWVKKGKKVLLMLGPCARCNTPKGRVLEAVLSQQQPIITHLVADSRTVRGAMKSMKSAFSGAQLPAGSSTGAAKTTVPPGHHSF